MSLFRDEEGERLKIRYNILQPLIHEYCQEYFSTFSVSFFNATDEWIVVESVLQTKTTSKTVKTNKEIVAPWEYRRWRFLRREMHCSLVLPDIACLLPDQLDEVERAEQFYWRSWSCHDFQPLLLNGKLNLTLNDNATMSCDDDKEFIVRIARKVLSVYLLSNRSTRVS